MPAHLQEKAIDRSTYTVNAAFRFAQSGAELTPDTLSWSLRNERGEIVNKRENVSVSPAASVSITMTGSDLAIEDGRTRYVTLTGLFTGDGRQLSLRDEVAFDIVALKG